MPGSVKIPEDVMDHLKLREGDNPLMYLDSELHPTFGIGIKANKKEKALWPIDTEVPKHHRDMRLAQESQRAYKNARLQTAQIGQGTNPELVKALTAVNFQLGTSWHKIHTATWDLLKQNKFREAAIEAEDSDWFGQTPIRVRDFQKVLMNIAKPLKAP